MKLPFTALSVLGVAAHNVFELGAGVGLVFQPQLGLRGAGAFWAITLPAMLAAMNRWEQPRAFLLGTNLAGVAVHFALWPVDWRRVPPLLTDAEGMGSRALPWYNALLYAWLGVTAVALATETRRRRWALAGLLSVLPLRASAAHHFRWLAEQARSRPAWWNRAAGPAADVSAL